MDTESLKLRGLDLWAVVEIRHIGLMADAFRGGENATPRLISRMRALLKEQSVSKPYPAT